MKRYFMYFWVLPLIFSISGCALFASDYSLNNREEVINKNYQAADRLSYAIKPGKRILVATVSNLNNLSESDGLGRLISAHIASRLTQRGYDVVEAKMGNGVLIKPKQGEFVLTRDVRKILSSQNIHYIVAGTYSKMDGNVFVSLKMLNPASNTVLSAYDYILPDIY